MSSFQIRPLSHPLKGEIFLPPDKSITHRAVILSAITKGKTKIKNFAFNDDCLSTLNAFKRLGIKIKIDKSTVIIYGRGLRGLTRPSWPISAAESATTMRLLLGVLAGQNFLTTLVADKSLSKRPMRRVIEPLRMMGAQINAKCKTCLPPACRQGRAGRVQNAKIIEEYPPITIKGGNLKSITYTLPVASAQVKSAILLAGLYCNGITKIIEPIKTRDHTERMLKLFGANIKIKGIAISIKGGKDLVSPSVISVPGDISSATFFIVAATIVPESCLVIKSVGLNPTRMGAIRVLKRMGADIQILGSSSMASGCEPVGDIIVSASDLRGTIVKRNEMPSLIDEVPILMVAACNAKGQTLFEGVEELRVKETDRINSMVGNLSKMGANIQVKHTNSKVNIIIIGTKHLGGTKVSSFNDHRTAMSMIIAGLKARGNTAIDNVDCINKSFPDFMKVLKTFK